MEIRRMGQTILGSSPFQSPLKFLTPFTRKYSVAGRSHPQLVFALFLSISQRPLTSHQTIRLASSSSWSDPSPSVIARKSKESPRIARYTITPAETATADPEKSKSKPSPYDSLLDDVLPSSPRHQRGSRPTSLSALREGYESNKHQQGSIAGTMIMPASDRNAGVRVSNEVSRDMNTGMFRKRAVRTIKSRPSLSRTIEITGKVDIGRGLILLKRLVAKNNIKRDQQLQRFYERPGLRRKRLRRERWRARFKESFHKVVEKVKAMNRMGW
ncbi:hypothetical protein MMC07_003104 [Pseudocyphellaria aurata]|nr:hypothetical protein [Pseudocyphellaria aurata]